MLNPEEVHRKLLSGGARYNISRKEGNRYHLLIDRNSFSVLFRDFGCVTGAEIGVQTGDYAQLFVKELEGTIYLIDPWVKWPREVYDDIANADEAVQENRYEFVCDFFKGKDVTIIRKTSMQALDKFEDKALDFVFIDANHAYGFIKDDLNGWWPKLRTNGIMSGHDTEDIRGVAKALHEFVEQEKLKYWYTTVNSYFFIKPNN